MEPDRLSCFPHAARCGNDLRVGVEGDVDLLAVTLADLAFQEIGRDGIGSGIVEDDPGGFEEDRYAAAGMQCQIV